MEEAGGDRGRQGETGVEGGDSRRQGGDRDRQEKNGVQDKLEAREGRGRH